MRDKDFVLGLDIPSINSGTRQGVLKPPGTRPTIMSR